MTLSTDIVASYRRPREVMDRRLREPVDEGRGLAFLMGACGMTFVSLWPMLSREAHLNPDIPLDARLGGALLAWVFIMPLVFYALAALSRAVASLFGGKGSGYSARIALFWSLLALSPLMLLRGLTAGFIGPGAELTLVSVLVVAGFVWLWGNALYESERTVA